MEARGPWAAPALASFRRRSDRPGVGPPGIGIIRVWHRPTGTWLQSLAFDVRRKCVSRAIAREEVTMNRSVRLLAISATALAVASVSAAARPRAEQISMLTKQMAAS